MPSIVTCVHLQKLYDLCQQHQLRFQLSGSDLVRIVCRECGAQDVCPSVLTDEYEAQHVHEAGPTDEPPPARNPA